MRPGSFARVTRLGKRGALIGLLLVVCVPSAFASWRAGGTRLVSGRNALEELSMLSDGAGGFVISISDTAQSRVYLQRGLVTGEVAPGWPAEGIAVETSRGGWRSTWPDGDGGVFVTWREIRSGRSRGRAQHLLADGTRAAGWPDSGAVVVEGPLGPAYYTVATDGAGGCYVAWQDFRNGYDDQDAYVQRLASDGSISAGWPVNGIPICNVAQDQDDPFLLPDGEGGFFAVWWDLRNRPANGWDVYATRMTSSGERATGWPQDGLALCVGAGDQMLPQICSDGAGGFFAAWTDIRDEGDRTSVYLTRVLPEGRIADGWPDNGAFVTPGNSSGVFTLRADGLGGVYLGCRQEQGLTLRDRTLHHWSGAGDRVAGWPQEGRIVFPDLPVTGAWYLPDDAGGVYAGASVQMPEPTAGLIHLQANGEPAVGWPEPWLAFPVAGSWSGLGMTKDGEGGVVVVWADTLRTGVFAQRVTNRGIVAPGWEGYPDAAWMGFPYPNPTGGAHAIELALPAPASVSLELYDARGARVANLGHQARPAGQQIVAWDGRDDRGARVPAGVYFLRLETSGYAETRRVCVIR